MSDYLHATIHDFKTNISRYLRSLERGDYRAVIVQRHSTPVALFLPISPEKQAALAAADEEDSRRAL